MRKIIASLDIGSFYIKLVVGEIFKGKLNILACVDTPSRGIKNGYVVNLESATESIRETFDKVNNLLGLKVDKVVVNVPSLGASTFMSTGSTVINSSDKTITHRDISKAMSKAVGNNIASNEELVSIMPTGFIVNDVDKVASPLKMIGEKLTVKAVGIKVPKKNITTIARCLENLNISIVDIAIGSLGDYYEFKTKDTANSVGAVINIGAHKTEISVFNHGILTAVETLDVGGNNLDIDFAFNYKLNRKDSMYIKEHLSLAHKSMARANESITFHNKNNDLIKVNQYDATEIAINRLTEMLNLIKKQINLLTKKEISYIMVTGGTTEYKDLDILLSEIFGRKVKVCNVSEIGVRNNKYSVGAGLIKYYYSRLKLKNVDYSIFSLEEQEELSAMHKKVNISDNSVLGKLFGYFFDS